MIYLSVFLLLVVGALLEARHGGRRYFWLCFFLLGAMLCLRYGQGTDYFGYRKIYYQVEGGFWDLSESEAHGEIGWLALCWLFCSARLPFAAFSMAVSVTCLCFLGRGLLRWSEKPCLSLALLYPTFYLTYLFSSVRQGLAICVFLGVMLGLLYEKKYLRYCLWGMALMLIHTSAVLYLALIPLSLWKKRLPFVWVCLLLAVGCVCGGLVYCYPPAALMERYSLYTDVRISALPLCERMLSILMAALFCGAKEEGEEEEAPIYDLLFNIYVLGGVVYTLLLWQPLIASRLSLCFKATEFLLVPRLCRRSNRRYVVVMAYFLALSLLMLLKNMASYIQLGNYYDFVTIWNFPYVSIFNKQDIFLYCDPKYVN